MHRFILLSVVVAIAASCRSIQPETPTLAPETYVAPAPPPSQIDIPVLVDLKSLYDQIEKNVPAKLNSTGYPGWQQDANCNLHYRWNFWREKLTFVPNNNTLAINCLGYYQGEGEARPCCWDWCPYVGTGCGMNEPPRQLQLSILSVVNISPTYQIQSNTAVTKLIPINRCKVTTLNFDITDNIMAQTRGPLDKACKDFDAGMAKFNLRGQVEQVWKTLHTPMAIDTFGFLVFNPSSLRISPITTKGDELRFSLGATANPAFLLNTANHPAPPKLPDLSKNPKQSGGFSVYLDTRLHYAELTKLVNAQMKGMKFDYGKKHIEVLEVQLSGTGNQKLLIKVNFNGSVKGWMYMTGTPQFDSVTKELILPDLDFDIKTRNVLLKSAKWLFNNTLTNSMRQNAKFYVGDMLTTIQQQVQQNLTKNWGNGINTTGKVEAITIRNLFPAPDYLQVSCFIKGDLDAQLKELK